VHLHFTEFQGPTRPRCPFGLSIIGVATWNRVSVPEVEFQEHLGSVPAA
jgi:hypothetical protein